MNKTIYLLSLVDDEAGEIEGMFTEDGTCLGGWNLNDAQWRREYFGYFMSQLGVTVKNASDEQKKEWRDTLVETICG